MNKILPILATAGAVLAVAAPALGAGASVRVADDVFKSSTVRIHKGQTVTWRWTGKHPHNVKFHGFASHVQVNGTFRHRFRKRGTFRYVCSIHSGMRGKVVVS